MLEKVVGEKLGDGTGEGVIDNSADVELSAEEVSEEVSSDGPFLDAFFGRRVSDVVLGLVVASGGD
jgi:hypothetical protein